MINIKTSGVKPYLFKDGSTVITTKNPSQSFYMDFISVDQSDNEAMLSLVDDSFSKILYPKDRHYVEELDYDMKLDIIKDYVEYHANQLEARFPNTHNR